MKKNAPQLQFAPPARYRRHLLFPMRVDTQPFDDVRVRRALNMAMNKKEIVDLVYRRKRGVAAYPKHPDYIGYFEPLEKMPDSVKELFTYNPDKAKALLTEAGYPNGFSFKVQVCSCSTRHMGSLLPLARRGISRRLASRSRSNQWSMRRFCRQ